MRNISEKLQRYKEFYEVIQKPGWAKKEMSERESLDQGKQGNREHSKTALKERKYPKHILFKSLLALKIIK